MKIIITNHAKKRIKNRLGLNKNVIEKISNEAFKNGLKHSEVKGSFKRYLDKIYLSHENGNNMRIYNQKIFLFHNNILITILDFPSRYKKLR